jgi:hypothetical protein
MGGEDAVSGNGATPPAAHLFPLPPPAAHTIPQANAVSERNLRLARERFNNNPAPAPSVISNLFKLSLLSIFFLFLQKK